MHVGIREPEARQLVARSLTDAGLKYGGCLTLFGRTRLNLMTPAPHLILPRKRRPPSWKRHRPSPWPQ